MTLFVVYLRVSTARHGASDRGIERQRAAVALHVASAGGRVVAEVIAADSSKRSDRPELARALALCEAHHATLLIARLDRMARNVAFISDLMEACVPFVAADMLTATPSMLHIYAAMSEADGKAICTRTKAALAAAKARGVKLGNPRLVAGNREHAYWAVAAKSAKATARPADLRPIIAEIRAAGVGTLTGVALALTARGVAMPSGRGTWSPASVMRLERRLKVAA